VVDADKHVQLLRSYKDLAPKEQSQLRCLTTPKKGIDGYEL